VEWFYFDAIHLSQRAMPLTLRALRNLFPDEAYPELPLPAPSWTGRGFDRVSKRVRRWLKLPHARHTFPMPAGLRLPDGR
jgi:hypothetical protein